MDTKLMSPKFRERAEMFAQKEIPELWVFRVPPGFHRFIWDLVTQ